MIVYDLKCRKDHVFEAWFPDSASFTAQAEAGKVVCPVCGSRKVTKALMAPAVVTSRRGKAEPADRAQETPQESPRENGPAAAALADSEKAGELRRMLRELRDHVEKNCDYVGDQFAEEARKIHYGESDPHGIYGETSDAEAKELQDEGIEVARVPWLPRENS
ncbi:DUF1178 family protein [Pelagibius marinus]|uniref:DUF1178 family protein n=1 Tax=Pelagibius marinus TaxID=2762760 RepID=UPI0018726541|nr:DUF1178 family protein [Pelagibius marinus]